jgi:hypothetical protein
MKNVILFNATKLKCGQLPPACNSTLPFHIQLHKNEFHNWFTFGLSSVVIKVPVQVMLHFPRECITSVKCEMETHVEFSVGNIAKSK